MKVLACDVSKDTLMPYSGSPMPLVGNCKEQIRKMLSAHPKHVVVCEATSSYHQELADLAYERGHVVYVVNPKEARSYKDSLSFRAKTDALDARYLYEYVLRNQDILRPYTPIKPELRRLKELISKRALAMENKVSLAGSFGATKSSEQEEVIKSLQKLIEVYTDEMKELASKYESYARMLTIRGVGPIVACALVFILESRVFHSADSAVAFLGLDVRIRQSGKFKGQPKLTKRGDATLRYLLCIAGRCLVNSDLGKLKRAQLSLQGRHLPERMVIGARKVIRTAFHLFTTNQEFDPKKWRWA